MQLPKTEQDDSPLVRVLTEFFDPDWYRARYPDVVAAKQDPLVHFIRYGAAELRDPNAFFDSAWYLEHHPDVTASGVNPLLHYLQAGARELRNPHPKFDAVYYVDQHPEAASNPVLFHLRIGLARGHRTERSIDISDYLPSQSQPLALPIRVFADAVIPVYEDMHATQRCILSVLADRSFPLARIIVIDDRAPEPKLSAWLREIAAEGQIHLIRNRCHLGFAKSVQIGIETAESHDVAVLRGDTEVPKGWLHRLAAQAYARDSIATVSPLSNDAAIGFVLDDRGDQTPTQIDAICQTVNAGRSVDIPIKAGPCLYIRRAAITAVGDPANSDFGLRANVAGWRHRLACDTLVNRIESPVQNDADQIPGLAEKSGLDTVTPFRFAVTAALFRDAQVPVILMVTHNLGGGVQRHIDSLLQRYRNNAKVLLLKGTERGTTLSIPSLPNHPELTLPADRLNDLVTLLRSMNVSRVHLHHLLQMDMDIRGLILRLGVPFDVTVHDYFAICPQVNLRRSVEAFYCGEPGPATCNACIASQSSHGARDIVSWRRDHAWQFIDADRVICPSEDARARLDRYGMAQRAIVVPHGEQTREFWNIDTPKATTGPLRVVLLGVLANHKGARVVAELAEAAPPGTIELHLIGHLEANFPPLAAKSIKVTGPYQDSELPDLLKQIDPHVFWFPAVWPETFSYTLSAAIATGRPIVASDLGSFPERLAGRPNSWLIDHRASAAAWLAAFENVRTALRNRGKPAAVALPRPTSDFYRDHYLSPAPGKTKATQKPRIVIVPERYDFGGPTPCAHIRLLQPLDHPATGDRFDITLADHATVFDCQADIIVTQRHAIPDPITANRLAEHARRTGAKLLYDLDDDLLSIPADHPDARQLHPLTDGVRCMLAVADAVWVSTPGLANRLASIRPDAVVIENRLDERLWTHAPAPSPFWDHPVRILCMGTSSHDHDFAMIEPALLRLHAEYGGAIAIDILGMTNRAELPAGLNRIGPTTHASRSYPGFVDWLTHRQPRWHIGLAPLLDTPFNLSKSPIKAMDYAALGLTVLASDTPVYRGSIADGPAGQLVANDPLHWHAAIDWLIRNQALRQTRIAQARQAFLAQATLATQGGERHDALVRLLPAPPAGLRSASPALTMAHDPIEPPARKSRPGHRGR